MDLQNKKEWITETKFTPANISNNHVVNGLAANTVHVFRVIVYEQTHNHSKNMRTGEIQNLLTEECQPISTLATKNLIICN